MTTTRTPQTSTNRSKSRSTDTTTTARITSIVSGVRWSTLVVAKPRPHSDTESGHTQRRQTVPSSLGVSCFRASGCFWLLLAASGCFWVLLGASGCFWLVLAAPGCFHSGCSWLEPSFQTPLAGLDHLVVVVVVVIVIVVVVVVKVAVVIYSSSSSGRQTKELIF